MMQRGFAVIFGVAAVLAAATAHAQPEVPGSQTHRFIGPAFPADGVEPGAGAAGEPASNPAGAAAKTESRPLGESGIGSFRERLAASEASRLDATGGASPSLKAGEGWWRTAGALAMIIALILALGAGIRRWAGRSGGLLHAMGAGGRAPSGLLHILGRYPVGRGQMLILLKLDRRVILVCQSVGAKGGGMRTLCEISGPEEVASIMQHAAEAEGQSISARFREMVSGFESSHEQAELVGAAIEVPRVHEVQAKASADPIGRLHTRLDSLRQAEWGDSA